MKSILKFAFVCLLAAPVFGQTTQPATQPSVSDEIKASLILTGNDQRVALEQSFIDCVDQSGSPSITDLHTIIDHLLPANDKFQMFVNDDAKTYLNVVVRSMRQLTGRIDRDALNTIITQITSTTQSSPPAFINISDEATTLAGRLGTSARDNFFRLALTGKYADAVHAGMALSTSPGESQQDWVRMVARVVRINDESYNYRVQSFIQWINGNAQTNPITDLLPEGK